VGHFYPPDDVTYGELEYLLARFAPDEADERRDRIRLTLKRLVRKGMTPRQVHDGLMAAIRLWSKHNAQQLSRRDLERWNAAVARARKDVDRALTSLRQLVPAGGPRIDDDALFRMRDLFLVEVVAPPRRATRGRPWDWKRHAEDALKKAGIVASDRRELVSALGFVDDE
jgi:hypothetical protein